jgi:hypothetical protein
LSRAEYRKEELYVSHARRLIHTIVTLEKPYMPVSDEERVQTNVDAADAERIDDAVNDNVRGEAGSDERDQ